MATIQTSLALVDNMSPVLQNISREVSNTVSKFQGLQNICQTSWNMPNLISAFSGAIKPISAVSGFVLTLAGDLSALSLATVSQSNAQSLLNSTMCAFPSALGLSAIVSQVGAIFTWVTAVDSIQNAWNTAKLTLITVWSTLSASCASSTGSIENAWDTLGGKTQTIANSIQNYVADMKTNVLKSLQSMVDGAITSVNDFINTVSRIPGVTVGTVPKVTVSKSSTTTKGPSSTKNTVGTSYTVHPSITLSSADTLTDSAKNSIMSKKSNAYAPPNVSYIYRNTTATPTLAGLTLNIPTIRSSMLGGPSLGGQKRSASIANADTLGVKASYIRNMAKENNSMNLSELGISDLRASVANAGSRSATTNINVSMNNDMKVNSSMDLDGVVGYLENALYKSMNAVGEGVHI